MFEVGYFVLTNAASLVHGSCRTVIYVLRNTENIEEIRTEIGSGNRTPRNHKPDCPSVYVRDSHRPWSNNVEHPRRKTGEETKKINTSRDGANTALT
ncbi:hypothetical protein KGM_213887 [Danaus plexippus plexippus]|uniref:Uncharacterized protein n=1 Tax=Danaus plexippus plexippus TaxID=278856 RepID=A0A212F542_DANPL|nr:hypothetical protein KGM_213887 [Danaus plexippus plexippus]